MAWMKKRADENFAAGLLALEHQHPNAAANRFWYALYHLSWNALQRAGLRPNALDSNATAQGSWKHETIKVNAGLIARHMFGNSDRELRFRLRALLTTIFVQRVNADYKEQPADGRLLRQAVDHLKLIFEEAAP